MPINLDVKCESCEEFPRNVYWKNRNTLTILCRACYNQRIDDIKKKTRGIVEKLRNLQAMENDFEKKRYCDFYHEHNNSIAAVRLLNPKEFKKRMNQENFLSTLFKYWIFTWLVFRLNPFSLEYRRRVFKEVVRNLRQKIVVFLILEDLFSFWWENFIRWCCVKMIFSFIWITLLFFF